jgi:hypothetical protein
VRVAYFGDDYALDIMEVKAINNQLQKEESKAHWDTFLVCEEMGAEDNQFLYGANPRLVPSNLKYWGHSYFTSGIDHKRNYFLFEASKVARYAVPFIKNIDRLISTKCKMPDQLIPTTGLLRPGEALGR